MSHQIIIGLTTEGPADIRFLENIVQRPFEHVAFECKGQIEVLPVQFIPKESSEFADAAVKNAKRAYEQGIMVFCIHADADDKTDAATFATRIDPAFSAINQMVDETVCKNLVAIVPVQMTEGWMLSDKKLLKTEIGTNKTDLELGIDKEPETYNAPKEVIKHAIRISRQDLTRRRRHELTIEELYSPVGQKIELILLEKLPSYRKFESGIRQAFQKMNLL